MNIAYLLQCLETTKFSDLVGVIDAVPLDMNLALWDAVAAGEITIDEEKDKVTVLATDVQPWHNPKLTDKLLRTIQYYAANGTNITRGRMNTLIKDPIKQTGYPSHEFIMSMQYLIDSGQVVEDIVSVPKSGKRPYHKFVFIGLPENEANNAEWNAKAVNKWIDGFAKNKVK